MGDRKKPVCWGMYKDNNDNCQECARKQACYQELVVSILEGRSRRSSAIIYAPITDVEPKRLLELTEDQYSILAFLWREFARSELDLDDNTEYLAEKLGEGAEFDDLPIKGD